MMSSTPLYAPQPGFDAASLTVTSSGSLNAAIKSLSATTGGTVYVDGTSGPYMISAKYLGDTGQNVLVRPLDPDVPPHVQQIDVVNASNLTITGMHIDSADIYTTRASWHYDINVINSSNISIVDNDMKGVADGFKSESNGATWGQRAVMLRDSENITFSDNTIESYQTGIVYLEVKGLEISGNDISKIQGDGMRGGGLQDAKITDNYLHDFYGTTQTLNHSDMIQIWGNGIKSVTQNVEISGNILDAGNGAATQGILILNEDFDRTGYYSNISIHNNVIHNALAQGIGVDHIKELEVYDNTVLWNQNAVTLTRDGADPVGTYPRLILRDSPDAYVSGNIVGPSILNNVSIPSGDNVILSFGNPESAYYAPDHFVNLSHQGDLGLTDLALRPDSPLFGNFGAALSSDPLSEAGAIANGTANPDLLAVISQSALPGAQTGVALSAEFSVVDGAPIDPDSATVRWIFQDGTVQEGLRVNQIFPTHGDHDITLEITDSSGQVSTMTRVFHADDPHLFALDFGDRIVDLSDYDSELEVRDPGRDGTGDGRDGSGGFTLTGKDKVMIDRTNHQFTGLDTFRIDVGLQLTDPKSFGELVSLHKGFSLKVLEGGKLQFAVETNEGMFFVKTDAPALTDTNWHDISVIFDSPAGTLQLEVDDKIMGTAAAAGVTTSTTGFDLILGSSWGTSVKAQVDGFAMTTQTSSIYDGTWTPPPVPDTPKEPDIDTDPDIVTDPVIDTDTGPDTGPDTGSDPKDDTPPPVAATPTILSNMANTFFTLFGNANDNPAPEPEEPEEPTAWTERLFDILNQTGLHSNDLPEDENEDEKDTIFEDSLL